MAHIQKYKAYSVGHMLAHYRRDPSSLGRANIDRDRTHLDYTLTLEMGSDGSTRVQTGSSKPNWHVVDQRLKKVDEEALRLGKRKTRKDAILMADMVVTQPDNVPDEDVDEFFKHCYEYLAMQVGSENLMGGFVHKDEVKTRKNEKTGQVESTGEPVRWHMHAPFTPIINGRFNFKKLCPRTFYQTFHRGLGDYLEAQMGYRPHVELTTEEQVERVYTDKARDIEKVRLAVEVATSEQKQQLAAVTQQLEDHRQRLEEIRSLEEKGLGGLVRAAGDKGTGAAKSAAQSANKELREQLGRLKREAGDLDGRIAEAQAERDFLEHRCISLVKQISRLESCIEDCWERLRGLAKSVTQAVPRSLSWVFDELGISYEMKDNDEPHCYSGQLWQEINSR